MTIVMLTKVKMFVNMADERTPRANRTVELRKTKMIYDVQNPVLAQI